MELKQAWDELGQLECDATKWKDKIGCEKEERRKITVPLEERMKYYFT